ncbi:hypothetical protein GCM10023079_38920 [Streptomyces chitinivorans]
METRTQYFPAALEVPAGLNGGRCRHTPAPVRTSRVPDPGPAVPPDDPPARAVAAPRAREAW